MGGEDGLPQGDHCTTSRTPSSRNRNHSVDAAVTMPRFDVGNAAATTGNHGSQGRPRRKKKRR
ncbi:hypothetical protein WN944_023839 [Citrus x changshan-huyou]|uniref:Uncharacterized protein n=1 Tax=Citrus x changshan-huyou TaxID=2935761 RepID=A0AAP0LMT0_9ROSI